MNVAGLDRLKSQLLTTGLQQKDNPLYQVINQLIDNLRQLASETTAQIEDVISGGSLGQTFATTANEKASLPNSRMLIPGAGIQFMETQDRLLISGTSIPGIGGESGEEGPMGVPGIQGPIGPEGPAGLNGLLIISEECEGCDSLPLPFSNTPLSGDGFWSNVTFDAANFTGNGTMTWTVAFGDIVQEGYTKIGKTLIVTLSVTNTSVGGTPDAFLQYKIPGGHIASRQVVDAAAEVLDNGVLVPCTVFVQNGADVIQITRSDAANFTASANATVVLFTIAFEVQ